MKVSFKNNFVLFIQSKRFTQHKFLEYFIRDLFYFHIFTKYLQHNKFQMLIMIKKKKKIYILY